MRLLFTGVSLVLILLSPNVQAQTAMDLLTVTGADESTETWSVSLQVLVFMTLLSVLPALLITMTSFTRIIIVLAILRQGLGTQQTPSNQVLVGIALFLTFFVMAPVGEQINAEALQPYLEESLAADEALRSAAEPLRAFMLAQTRESDLAMFAGLAGNGPLEGPDQVPFSLLLPAFVTSELKTAFQIGFLLLIPFLVVDLVVASVLMSMGMVMLSPLIISLPFKIMLFVLVDGWSLVMTTLAGSFFI
ncbi:MAG: flagellar biosynthetic protein FliP [Gammaproteobacteria bacterium]|nr:MAG: flagellar biosynthetic protein FliP [Gammaproteobacteria bacterium]